MAIMSRDSSDYQAYILDKLSELEIKIDHGEVFITDAMFELGCSGYSYMEETITIKIIRKDIAPRPIGVYDV